MVHSDSLIAWAEEQRKRLQAIRDDADADLAALDRVLAMLRRASREKPAHHILALKPEEIAGLSVIEAAIRIAEKHDGVLASTPARELMVAAGVLEDTRASSTVLYTALNGDDRFEKGDRRGEYVLVGRDDKRFGVLERTDDGDDGYVSPQHRNPFPFPSGYTEAGDKVAIPTRVAH